MYTPLSSDYIRTPPVLFQERCPFVLLSALLYLPPFFGLVKGEKNNKRYMLNIVLEIRLFTNKLANIYCGAAFIGKCQIRSHRQPHLNKFFDCKYLVK